MQVTIPAELERFVGEQVASGAYDSPESVVEAGLRNLATVPRMSLEEIEAETREGYRQAKAGEFFEGTMEDIAREARAQFEASKS